MFIAITRCDKAVKFLSPSQKVKGVHKKQECYYNVPEDQMCT